MSRVLAIVAATGIIFPTIASAQAPTWHGKGCAMGAAKFVVCSADPAIPDDPSPCYVSHFANYTPDPIQMDLIRVCQAAKVALTHLDRGLTGALTDLNAQMFTLDADVQTHRQAAAMNADSVKAVAVDMKKAGNWVVAYSQTHSADDKAHVEDALTAITNDAQVWGG